MVGNILLPIKTDICWPLAIGQHGIDYKSCLRFYSRHDAFKLRKYFARVPKGLLLAVPRG